MKKIGRYEIVEELGRGAMGVVYKASDPTIGRLVAVKVLSLRPSKEAGLPGVGDIFIREARAAGRLSHPGIVAIHDALEDPESKNNYIVMEFVPGRTLENVLLSGPPLSTEKAFNVIRQVAEALEYAHENQIIHRDLKPANILLTDDGHVKITDFGIAKIAAREGALRTAAVMGTPAYMSPEQVTGSEVDARSDLFSLGILLYLMLTGEKPFAGDTAAVMFKIVYEDPVPPSHFKPELNPQHDFLVLRCLAKDRNKRYGSAREFLDDLDDVLHGRPPRSEGSFPLAELRAGERTLISRPPQIPFGAEKGTGRDKKLSWVMAGIGAAVVLLVAVLGLGTLVFRHRRTPPEPKPASLENSASSSTSSNAAKPPGNTASTAPKTSAMEQPVRSKLAQKSAPKRTAAPKTLPGKVSNDRPATAASTSTKPAAGGKLVQLNCKYELEQAILTISGDSGVIFRGNLKGKKKGGFLGIKGGFGGTLSRPLTVPAGTHNLSVHVVSEDGSLDLSKNLAANIPAGHSSALHIIISNDQLNLHWSTRPHPND